MTVDWSSVFLMWRVPRKVHFSYELESKDDGAITRTGVASINGDGYWRYLDEKIKLAPGDKVQYSTALWTASGKIQGLPSQWIYAPVPTLGPRHTRAVVFRDDFNGANLDRAHWKYEVSMFGEWEFIANWEFQVYTPEHANVFLQNGHLFLKPTLTISDPRFNEHFLTTGTMDMTALWGVCTNSGNYGCTREGRNGMLPPSCQVKYHHTTIRFGQVEVRARIPVGDWIWPAIWMMPRDSAYGTWPRSGEIDIMESRGNLNAHSGGVNHGVNEVSSTLHWGTAWDHNHYSLTHGEVRKSQGNFHTEFHTWKLDWTHDHIITSVDGQQVLRVVPPAGGFTELGHVTGSPWPANSKMAPFDHDFFLILNVAVGGTNGYFPDGWNYGVAKPWPNNSPHANADFWAKRNQWESTWHGNNAAMEIDYVELRSL
ncbi:LOW QUALITY PROTEIN: beta-1,3-glucan-binding protein-like [Pomacea canaliculata]|uniref:LOW QUALITY PROTEIN: beta-1,3-glucan-binding protein-like n=1 Tax=Pomacea canaliculata TaxID=400727 RepID=UPI000D730DC5|nr:LOW QUALITY PROTEIN: beta-1,3-glucan-binding protein-like [Pomacea canaliculata]